LADTVEVHRPIRRRTLWLGFAAVLAPLAVLLVLQYQWLVKLHHASGVAHQAALTNYLEAVAEKVRVFYTWEAEKSLNLPSYVFTEDHLEKAALYFKKKQPKGARRLFVVSFVGPREGETLYYNPACTSVEPPAWSPEVRAVYVATSSWHTLAHKGGALEPVTLAVDERDPRHRIVLYPVTDDRSQVVGVAGMILDEDYLREVVLPETVAAALPSFFPGDRDADPAVWVRDGRGGTVFASEPGFRGPAEVEKPLRFAFTDWRLALASRHPTPGDWARSNFRLNVALSAALAAVLLGGVVLALRAASREMKLSQMKSDFVSNVSHELRTPLASIRVFGELLRLGRVGDGAKVREYGEYIETESRRLTQLINNLLDFSRIESGRKSYRLEPADLEELVRETLHSLEVRLRKSGFRVAYRGPAAPLPALRLDPAAITHSLANLLDNAVKYSGDGRDVEVTLARRGDEVRLAVRDWGIGVPRDEQEKIFDRFHRVSTGLVHDVKGSGLGLAIVRHVVDAHGGRVEVDSRSGQGSTFTLVLPLAALAVEEAAPEAAADSTGDGPLGLPPRRPSEA
jgi:signal transduction histidine kinase